MQEHSDKTLSLIKLRNQSLMREAEINRSVQHPSKGLIERLALTTGDVLIAAGTRLKTHYTPQYYKVNLEVK
ncbi:MAG: hypothetical protein JXB47_11350 [Anaerolineae bacterium]|nr:hypothetical protein [Anaerolineae bacterium]